MASKVLLVEDDNNLRDIYQARLQAEGYDIVTAKDGEEALVLAKREQPDLIISDVMMPRVSGFEMLDILRNTEGLKDPKVIMLTALGQADDQSRAEQLGADRYLVKSQVTLEDIVKAAQDLLGGDSSSSTPAVPDPSSGPDPTSTTTSAVTPVVANTPLAMPPSDPTANSDDATPTTPEDINVATPAPTPAGSDTVVTQPVEADPNEADPNDQLIADALKDLTSTSTDTATEGTVTADAQPVSAPTDPPPAPAAAPAPPVEAAPPVATPEPAAVVPPAHTPAPTAPASTPRQADDDSTMVHKKVISPISDHLTNEKPDINELLAKEEAQNIADPPPAPAAAPAPPVEAAPPVATPEPAAVVPPAHTPGNIITPPAAPDVQPAPAPAAPPEQTTASGGNDELDPNAVAL